MDYAFDKYRSGAKPVIWVSLLLVLAATSVIMMSDRSAERPATRLQSAGVLDSASTAPSAAAPQGVMSSERAACSTTAEADITAADDPMGRRGPNFPSSRRPDPGVQPLAKAEAEARARVVRAKNGDGPAPMSALASSRQMAYAEFTSASGMPPDKFVNPERCVWVISIDAPFEVPTPYGVGPLVHPSYSVVLDAGSGSTLQVGAPSFSARGLGRLP